MSRKPLSLVHRIYDPAPSSARPPLLLLLHGVGSNEDDLITLAPYLDRRFFVVSARAPYTLAPGAYAWFHVAFTPDGPSIDAEEAERSRVALLAFINELLTAYQLDAERVYLLGFSQGAIMSQSLALTQPDPLAGIVAMSGRILPEVEAQLAAPEPLTGLPVLVVHGTDDTVLPIRYGRAARDRWATLPVALTYREFPMGHQISAESLQTITVWLTARLDSERRMPPREE
jgi:phospholipase/carboxylesterase